ncbi:MAG: DNA recombination protein RmuC [Pseudomonadota bacterium]
MIFLIIFLALVACVLTFFVGRYVGRIQAASMVAAQESQLNILQSDKEARDRQFQEISQQLLEKERALAGLESQLRLQEERLLDHKQEVLELQNQFKERFENLANRIFEERTVNMQESSEKNLQQLLAPFKEKMHLFQEKMETIYAEESREIFSMKNEINRIVEVNQKISQEASNLTKALKGDVKMQGNWGEVVLERILEVSGLREGLEYILQGKDMGLKDTEGRRKLPDVTIKIPGDKNIFVDAKVSLVSYERYVNCDNPDEKKNHQQDFLTSVYAHIDLLCSKEYSNLELSTPDFVLLFFPIEGSFALALQSDQNIYQYALEKSIILVGPTTLLATLRTVAHVWKGERQNQNVLEIARQGGALYDKFCALVEDFKDLGARLGQAQTSYEGVLNKLSTGKGNLLSRAERLRELGVKANKTLSMSGFEEQSDDFNTSALPPTAN